MGRFKSKSELIADIRKERSALERLMADIPDEEAKAGEIPRVPTADYKWNPAEAAQPGHP